MGDRDGDDSGEGEGRWGEGSRPQGGRCACSLSDAGFCDEEQAVLHIVRCYCASYTRSPAPCWEDAIDLAVAKFGDFHGPAIAVATLNVLRQMRPCRKSAFSFNNPYCERCASKLTECERLLIQTLHCVRCNDQSGAAVEAMMLCEGHETGPLMEEMGRLSNALLPVTLNA